MTLRLIPAERQRRMPWKNGGGETIEIAAHPAGADLDGFMWRVSTARVAAAGPFSTFPGVDRTLVLLAGEALDLAIAGHGLHRMTVASEPLAFPADVATTASLPAGAIIDLNVMTRRGTCRHGVARHRIERSTTLALSSRWTLLVPTGACRVSAASFDDAMRRGDAVLAEGPQVAATIAADTATVIYVVAIDVG